MQIILASKSPARRRLLTKMGLKFDVLDTNTGERSFKAKSPASLVQKITLAKAKYALNTIVGARRASPGSIIVITADSIVYLPTYPNQGKFLRHFPNGPIFGKAKSKSQAVSMLKTLSNSTHRLYTGLCVAKISRGEKVLKNYVLTYDKALVTFKKLSDKEINDYIAHESAVSFAGSYTIERHSNSSSFIQSYRGSLNTIIGLPTKKLKNILFENFKIEN